MSDLVRRFAGPGIALLAEAYLQVAGVQDVVLANAILGVAVVWGAVAFVTWPPVWDRLPHFGVRQAIRERLPFEVRSPFVPKPVVPIDESAFGLVDFEHYAVKALGQMSKTLKGLAKTQQRITRIISIYTPRFANSIHASSERKRRVARSMASQLAPLASDVERKERELRAQTEAMSRNYLKRIQTGPPSTDAADVRASLVGMREATRTSRESMTGYRATLQQTRNYGYQQALNEVVDRLIEVATKIVSDFDMTTRFTTQAIKAIDDKAGAPARRSRSRRTAGPAQKKP